VFHVPNHHGFEITTAHFQVTFGLVRGPVPVNDMNCETGSSFTSLTAWCCCTSAPAVSVDPLLLT
jgi:hypothetical protein